MSVSTCAVSVPLNLIAWSLWSLSFASAALDWFLPNSALTATAILLGVGGATVHVRGFVTQLEQREAHAFRIGQDSVRAIR